MRGSTRPRRRCGAARRSCWGCWGCWLRRCGCGWACWKVRGRGVGLRLSMRRSMGRRLNGLRCRGVSRQRSSELLRLHTRSQAGTTRRRRNPNPPRRSAYHHPTRPQRSEPSSPMMSYRHIACLSWRFTMLSPCSAFALHLSHGHTCLIYLPTPLFIMIAPVSRQTWIRRAGYASHSLSTRLCPMAGPVHVLPPAGRVRSLGFASLAPRPSAFVPVATLPAISSPEFRMYLSVSLKAVCTAACGTCRVGG
ncbi:hypothetical protein DFP72DRAFT_634406 [Ephemerocybe angulata]|uniref:Uncharacterized protein n=1 Tax=Ephemerocybe angulata TaxID=980116 RepID=A0A8H6HGE3_9AGAR|nr:hypothetical protein DFP72DRAFT_634406 [Tulosesus angulatus]